MYGIPDRIKPVSTSEEAVLLALWASRLPASRREIAAHLPPGCRWADATLLNFLYRLQAKGWVTAAKQGNRNVYTPAVTRRAYGVYCMRERLARLFDGDLAAAVQALVSESGCTAAELERAAAVLEEKRAQVEEYDLYDPYG